MAPEENNQTRKWWKEGVCYQVWPQSFKDSNGDGVGDIQGLISKLDYLKDLGVDYIWMSPMYASPRDDYGYDISNYEAVNPVFGTLQDMDELIAGVHARGMRLMLDLVVNHTSTQHRWFQESSKSKDNEYSNYYMWRDPKIVNGQKCPPNNWEAFFGGSAWEYVEARDQYYLRLFLKSMPDLNWEDATVRKAIYKSAIEFWLARGVDGFRVDVVCIYSKDLSFPDAPIVNPDQELQPVPPEAVAHGPRIHEFLQEQRQQALDKFGDVALVGECGSTPTDTLKGYLSPTTRELDMIFDFGVFAGLGNKEGTSPALWKDLRGLSILRKGLMTSQGFMSEHGLWSTTFLENHDVPRSISVHGARHPQNIIQSGKLLAMLVTTLSGTLFVYQGQEIGMSNIPIEWDESELKDPFWVDRLNEAYQRYSDDADARKRARLSFQRCGRDHARTPVQWTSEAPHAGFSTGTPWMRVNENFKDGISVEHQQSDPDSLLSFWKQMLKFRKQHLETLIYGYTRFVDVENEKVFSVIKEAQGDENEGKGKDKKLLVILNYSDAVQDVPSAEALGLEAIPDKEQMLLSTGGNGSQDLQPWEGRIFQL